MIVKKKILIVTPGYFPAKNYGGPVISISNIVANFNEEYDISIITSNYEFKEEKRLIQDSKNPIVINNAEVYYLDYNQMNSKIIGNYIGVIRPDLIYINALFYYQLTLPILNICKKNKIRLLIAPRGGLCKNALDFGKIKKLSYIKFLNLCRMFNTAIFQSTSAEETEAIKKYICKDSERIFEISNLPAPFSGEKKQCRKNPGSIRIVFFSRIHPKKNLLYAIKTIQRVKGNVQFDIYGPIEDKEYWNLCNKEIEKCNNNIEVKYCGYLEHDDIPKILSLYHLFFFPTLSENYGHVIVEALESKCLVLLSNNTPWNDVEECDVGRAFSLDDMNAFARYIDEVVSMDDAKFKNCINSISTYLEKKLQISDLLSAYREVFG